jgi:four helix bundle protein
MQNFKSLKVWEYSHGLTLQIYKHTKAFPKDETYALTSQIRIFATTFGNIGRNRCCCSSNLDFARYLQISLGSANEVEYFLLLSKDLNYLSEEHYLNLNESINKIKAMLINLIQQVRIKDKT